MTTAPAATTASSPTVTPWSTIALAANDPYQQTDQNGVKALASFLQRWHDSATQALVVMQTFGEDGVAQTTAPTASASWLNDGFLRPTTHGLDEWNTQPLVKASSSGLSVTLHGLWNPGYPTVAGQVGDLTGQVGHDIVANLGATDPTRGGVPISRITMVAPNHRYDPELSFVKGQAAPEEGRLVGTLNRDHQSNWSVVESAPDDVFGRSELWSAAFAAPTPWPNAATDADRAAMRRIAFQLWGDPSITDVRPQYVLKSSEDWNAEALAVERIAYAPGLGFDENTFGDLQTQVAKEMRQVAQVKRIVGDWKSLFTRTQSASYVDLQALADKIVSTSTADAKKAKSQSTELDPLEIISESLYVAGDIADLSGNEEVGLPIGAAASVFGLADVLTPHDETGEEGPDTGAIRDRADELGKDLVARFDASGDTLDHITDLLVSDSGKLDAAARNAVGPWAFGTRAKAAMLQSLAVTTSRQLYDALLPLAYKQWVVAPYVTYTNGSGPDPTGRGYQCRQYDDDGPDTSIKRPFKDEPNGGVFNIRYRPEQAPGATTPPAQPYAVPYLVRALKSRSDGLRMDTTDDLDDQGTYARNITHDGSSPKGSLVDRLFQPVNPRDSDPSQPTNLGEDPTTFFGGFGDGPTTWGRAICASGR